MDRPKSVTIAKWGAACSPCALAKAKCLRSSDSSTGSKCDRKTAQLEERLNSLVNLLKATNSGEVSSSARQPVDIQSDTSCVQSETDADVSAHCRTPYGDDTTSPLEAVPDQLRVIPGSYNVYAPQICICRAQVGEVPMPVESDEALLATFVNKLMPEYPFVTLRPGITAAEMVSTRPFLFATIRMVSSYRNLKSMRAQNYLIMKHISEQMLMRSERSLEMLQSLLLVLGYYHYQCMMHAQMSNLIALANSLVADLGINRLPELQERTRLLVPNPEAPKARTSDEKRALCGVWYMNSIVALAFQRMDPIKYTPYADQCLKDLDSAKEYETDSLLVLLVRIQHLSERIAQLHDKDNLEDDLTGITRAPMNAYFGVFQAELDKYRTALPRQLRSNKLILCHMNTATLRLWEPPVIDMALLEKISTSFTSLTITSASSLDVFYRSNAALKAWFEYWLSIEVTEYFVLPMPVCAQLINAVTMLARWAKLSSPEASYPQTVAMATASSATQSTQGASSTGATPDSVPVFKTGDSDPAIPAAVSAIKAHFLSQPELQIDILNILQAMGARFEEARREVSTKQGGVWDNNIWDLAARKISITRLKLERWADIVASMGGESLLGRRYESTATSNTEDSDLSEPAPERDWPMDGMVAENCAQQPHDGWHSNASWAHDLFEGLGLDQNFFFDGPGDYGTVVLNSLGPSGV
ncbi:Uu.00g036360.m01.CDS01 [Anthostomella pinea]|uniref:Uu.00g036360.m01.CDS01 n=1 Tax=Anthostomella pinea TaxID=933095 RepID=A0AAI8V4I0_9PEZI|nr:Uu.00g036360.m01.CDS01 [Anthostomella pinea]